ncbi:flippase [Gordonia soli]|uniref:Uncharacterized protein n=1 Tax=Gordonia soli NBRC 108243 TaxID=1223545 RepID=M0QFY6_9ACTN|nr:flippase [Gordonia soli]GAC67483.1 hypothetical protein GS4_08_00670 [Gordonia soli NBRC 108243]
MNASAQDRTTGSGSTITAIARAFAQQMAGRVGGTIASLATVALTTRTLGPENYGQLTAAVMFVTLWMSLTEFGVGEIIVRRVTDSQRSVRPTVHRLVQVNLGISLTMSLPLMAVAMVSGILVYHNQPQVVGMLVIISVSLALTTLHTAFDPVFTVMMRFGAVALADFLGRVLTLGLTIGLVVADAPVYTYAFAQIIPPLGQLIIKAIAARRLGPLTPLFRGRESLGLLRESLPIALVLVIAVLYWRIDGVLLSVLSNPVEVGHFGLAYSIAFMATMVSELFLASTLSTTTRLFQSDRAAFGVFVRGVFEAMYFVAVPVAVVGAVLAGPLITLLSSDSFSDGAPVLALLFLAAAITFLNGSASQALFAAHDQHFLLRLNAVTLTINIVLNVILIPLLGAVGAGIALVATEVIGFVVARVRLARRSPVREPWSFIVRLAIPAAGAGIVAWSLHGVNPVLALLAAAIVYLGVNLLIGPVTPGYIRSFRAARSVGADDDGPVLALPPGAGHVESQAPADGAGPGSPPRIVPRNGQGYTHYDRNQVAHNISIMETAPLDLSALRRSFGWDDRTRDLYMRDPWAAVPPQTPMSGSRLPGSQRPSSLPPSPPHPTPTDLRSRRVPPSDHATDQNPSDHQRADS